MEKFSQNKWYYACPTALPGYRLFRDSMHLPKVQEYIFCNFFIKSAPKPSMLHLVAQATLKL